MAIDYNEFIAQATNRQTVLNILRAREREPMHFSSFGEIVGSVRGTGAVQVGSVVNGDTQSQLATDTVLTRATPPGMPTGADTTITRTITDNLNATNLLPQFSLQVATGTDFKVQANASDEFYRGILNPVPAATVVHFLRQGFPPDLLSHLLIGRIELSARITGPAYPKPHRVPLRTIANSPDEDGPAAAFARAIRCRQLDYVVRTSEEREIPLPDLSVLGPLTPETARRLIVRETEGSPPRYFYTVAGQNEFGLVLSGQIRAQDCEAIVRELKAGLQTWVDDNRADLRVAGTAADLADCPPEQAPDAPLRSSSPELVAPAAGTGAQRELGQAGEIEFNNQCLFQDVVPAGYRGDLVIDITLRSVQGTLYYLGEYIRRVEPFPLLRDRRLCPDNYCLPILVIREAAGLSGEPVFARVNYRGRDYAIPLSGRILGAATGRSSQTIDLVQQLLNLNRSSRDLPTTPLVRVTN